MLFFCIRKFNCFFFFLNCFYRGGQVAAARGRSQSRNRNNNQNNRSAGGPVNSPRRGRGGGATRGRGATRGGRGGGSGKF